LRTCANPDCNIQFEPKSHNQKYHNSECCRVVTNKRIMEKYYEEKEIREGKERICSNNGCEVVLTRYNLTSTCFSCDKSRSLQAKSLLDRLVV
jgi:hypothetical protein